MKLNVLSGSLLGLALMGVVATAAADATEKPVGVGLRIGAAWPTDRGARDAAGDTWTAFGVDYKISDLNLKGAPAGYASSIGLSVDYASRGDYRILPVLVNYVGHLGGLFFEAGAGASFGKIGGDDKVRAGYGVGLGYEFNSGSSATPAFLEAKLLGSDRKELNAIGVYIGVRF